MSGVAVPRTTPGQTGITTAGTTTGTTGGGRVWLKWLNMAQWQGQEHFDESFIFRAKARAVGVLSMHKENAPSCTYTAVWFGSW